MHKEAFLRELEIILELPVNTLHGDEDLENIGAWDSLAILEFIAWADKKLQKKIEIKEISLAVAVEELYSYIAE